MKNWNDVLISSNTPIFEAIEIIDEVASQIALVVDENKRLLGTVTDGDIRRGILKRVSLDSPVHRIMHETPVVAKLNDGREKILALMSQKKLRHIPVLDEVGCVVGIETIDELIDLKTRDNVVVLMAGGLGRRLQPLTNDCPKPLLKIGNKPILETIIKNFVGYGFRRFYISINYKAEMVKEYFKDGSRWGVEICYIHEDKPMGTAGCLGLLPEKLLEPLLVMNGDLLTNVNFQSLLEFHSESKAQATICVREYDFKVPYGVVKVDKNRLVGIDEKPMHKFFVNAGIYVLEPEILDLIPRGSFYDMPTLYERLIKLNYETIVFPIREYWLDIGYVDDLEKAKGDYKKISDD